MIVVMGATGHVGGAVAEALLARGEAVTVLTRHPDDAGAWRDRGADVVAADAADAASLRAAFRRGRRAFLLNPPADPAGDTDATELRTIAAILAALDGSGLEKVVAASTYGARPGQNIGDLTTLWQLEEGLRNQPIPAAINRGAYYMSNWVALAPVVKETGSLPSKIPADMPAPTVAPHDLGEAAAARLLSPVDDTGVRYVEGPERYTPRQVADAFARAMGREVRLDVVPRERWAETWKAQGFSDAAVAAYARMTAVSIDEHFAIDTTPERGRTTLEAFIAAAIT